MKNPLLMPEEWFISYFDALENSKLDPSEFRVCLKIARRSYSDWYSVSIAGLNQECKVGLNKTRAVLQFLVAAGFIYRKNVPGGKDEYRAAPQEKWVPPQYLMAIRDSVYNTTERPLGTVNGEKKERSKRSNINSKKRFKVHESNGWACHYCGKQLIRIPLGCKSVGSISTPNEATLLFENPTLRISPQDFPYIDHKVPVCRGGTNDIENLTTCCWECNSKKGDRYTETEFLAMVGGE